MRYAITEAKLKKFHEAVALGASYRMATRIAGIPEGAFYHAKRDGQALVEQIIKAEAEGTELPVMNERDKICLSLVEGIWKHEGDFITRNLTHLRNNSAEDWRAAAWALERRFPLTFGRQVTELHSKIDGEEDRGKEGLALPDVTAAVNAILLKQGVRATLTTEDLEDAVIEVEVGAERMGQQIETRAERESDAE